VLEQQVAQIVYVGDAHQQIYDWRGAINAMEKMTTAHTCYLTQSFRFGPRIAEHASKILEGLGERKSLRGNGLVDSFVSPNGKTQTVLTRTNSMVIAEVLAAIEAGVSPHIVGGADEIKQMVGDVFNLKKGEPANHPDFFGFRDWDEVVAFSQTEEGEDLVRFVQLIERYGERQLWFAVKNTQPDETAAVMCISTAHKAKGREWETVRIAEDFAVKLEENGAIDPAEARLFYVSITRAQKRSSCGGRVAQRVL
jgi:superfamily I DNA/RNA helicase